MSPDPQPVGAAEQCLLDAARRAARQPGPALALALHLSVMRPPAPRPHHRRIARAMLHDAAQQHGGQVLALAGGDLVLLCPDMEAGQAGGRQPALASLPALLGRLLHADAPDAQDLVSVWPLPEMAAALLAYATARPIVPPPAIASNQAEMDRGPEQAVRTGLVDALDQAVDAAGIADLLHRQTAILLPPRQGGGGGTLIPVFRALSFSIAALEARAGGGPSVRADPFLFRHLAARLDRRMLDLVAAAQGGGGPLDGCAAGSPPLHLNLTLTAVESAAFARFAGGYRRTGIAAGIEIAVMEACADPAGFARAAQRIRAAGFAVTLGGLSHHVLSFARLAPLQPDLVKLDWTPHMAALERDEAVRLAAALDALGAHRLLLARANTEAAVRWGLAHGIRRFQGRHVDAMLAASRLAACEYGDGCTLRQCTERESAAGEAGRRFCRNSRLLDAGAPDATGMAASAQRARAAA